MPGTEGRRLSSERILAIANESAAEGMSFRQFHQKIRSLWELIGSMSQDDLQRSILQALVEHTPGPLTATLYEIAHYKSNGKRILSERLRHQAKRSYGKPEKKGGPPQEPKDVQQNQLYIHERRDFEDIAAEAPTLSQPVDRLIAETNYELEAKASKSAPAKVPTIAETKAADDAFIAELAKQQGPKMYSLAQPNGPPPKAERPALAEGERDFGTSPEDDLPPTAAELFGA